MAFKLHTKVEVENDKRNLNTSLSPENFLFQLTETLKFKRTDKQYFCRIEDIRIPISFYNINSNYNTFTFNDNGVDYTVIIPPGNYTIDDLRNELQTQMNATASLTTYSIVYAEIQQKITITSDGAGGITTITASNGGSINTLYKLIGFDIGQTIPDGGSATGNNVAYTNTAKTLKIILDNVLSNNAYSNIRHSNNEILTVKDRIAVNVPITEIRNEFQFIENHDGAMIKMSNISSINELRVRLVDTLGNTVEMNGVPWGFTFNVYEYNY